MKATFEVSARLKIPRIIIGALVCLPVALSAQVASGDEGSATAQGSNTAEANYGDHPQAQALMAKMIAEHGFEQQQLQQWMTDAKRKQKILDAMSRPAERVLTWAQYRNIFIKPQRVQQGVEFWRDNREALQRASETYGVPEQLVVAVIGVETRYGQNKGHHRVIDALATLAFDYPKRSPFFTKELEHFLLLTREQSQDPLALKGSYAGAMGYGQFMPSSYRAYAADFDGDGVTDIWNNQTDAIGSVANYFARHGWREGEPVVMPAQTTESYNHKAVGRGLKPRHTVAQLRELGMTVGVELDDQKEATAMELRGEQGTEHWMGMYNFYVITRYNHSHLYAMAVYQLSEEIAAAMANG